MVIQHQYYHGYEFTHSHSIYGPTLGCRNNLLSSANVCKAEREIIHNRVYKIQCQSLGVDTLERPTRRDN